MAPPFPYAAEAAALGSSLLWAAASITFRRMRGRLAPAALNLTKNTVATACFAVVALALWGRPWPTHVPLEAQGWLALSGLVGLTACDTFLLRAFYEIGPRRATLLVLVAPVLVLVGSAFPPFGQREALHSPSILLGIALALAGVALTALEGPSPTAPGAADDPEARARRRRGIRDGLLAGVLQAAGVLLAKRGLDLGAAPHEGAEVRLAAGAAGLVALGAVTGQVGAWRRELSAPGTLRTVATAAFFGTFLGIGLNQCGLAWARSSGAVTTLNSLAPVWLIPLSRVLLGERHGRVAWLSTALAVAGVALLAD